MAWRVDKATGDIILDGVANGIAMSPHRGIANIQGGNIATENGEVLCNYGRARQSQVASVATGTLSYSTTSFLNIGTINELRAGIWITVSGSSDAGQLPNANYYVVQSTNGLITVQLATAYGGAAISGFMPGLTANFTIIRNMGSPVAYAIEKYSTTSAFNYRYYVLDALGLLWVYDSGVSVTGLTWFLPDTDVTSISTRGTGLCVLNGWVMAFAGNTIWCKPTVLLGATPGWVSFAPGLMVSPAVSPNPHFAYVGHQGKAYYTDGNYLGSIFPNTSLVSGVSNVQSYALYTAVTTTGTVATLINGALPTTSVGSTRIPAVFFSGGTKPAAITVGTVYYIAYSPSAATFEVFAAASGGSALDIATGSAGTQYFNTFYPTSAGGGALITFTPQRLNLPAFEIAQALTEIGNTVVIGCKGNVLYPWNQVDSTPGDLISLPENNVTYLLTAGNMAYIFAGSKGNIYITNGSTASFALSVPDYCAGIAGTPKTYIDPYFTWGGAMYLRGRVWFSILDQTSSKAGNCGGVWSFVPAQNFFVGTDTGLALRLESQASYGTYSGVSTLLIPNQTQTVNGAQYWNAWYSSITSPLYGIDGTDTTLGSAVIEFDLIPTGTMLDKETFSQLEYKLSAPLGSGESVSLKYRLNATDAFATCGSVVAESVTEVSGYFTANFEKSQWLQLQVTLTGSALASFTRLKEIRIR
jgi:hypothetical protein